MKKVEQMDSQTKEMKEQFGVIPFFSVALVTEYK